MRNLITILGAIGLALMVASPVAANKPSYGCGPGFDIGQVTYAQFVQLPRIQAGISAGAYTQDDIVSALSELDKNGNGEVCAQLSAGYVNRSATGPNANYFYNAEDDNSAKR